ncbi:MAG TPA: AsmA-like C-terminal domain-containing protein, partial [Desulfurivibrionaceae bacterium]|nr:AsmA-like C-terminal domain-containing protein [Desulfurivibrionaceae bacterium]
LEKLRVDWDSKKTAVTGTIKAGQGGNEAPTIKLDLTDTPERFTLRELLVSAPPESGRLTLDYPKATPNRISLNWQGFVESDSILTLLSTNIIHAQRLEGNFAIQLPLRPGGHNLQGWLKVRGLEWAIGDAATPVVLNDLNLRGEDDGTLIIERALIDSRDSREVEVNGTINPAAKQLDFKLNLTADLLARTTVEAVTRGLGKLTAPEDPADPAKKWESRGTLQFRIERFEPGPAADPGKPVSPASSYVLAPAKGFLTLRPSGGYSLDLRSSKVCGVDISGTIYSAPEEGENSLNFYTDSAKPLLLQEVIPCLGFSNTMIEGPLHLDGSLQGTTRNWRDGKISLYSEKGFIRRLGFLAKVFSVVNLTDLFTTQPLPKLGDDGFAYSSFEIESRIKDNQLLIEKAVVKGTGLNLFGEGKIDLQSGQADLTIMVAPLKTIDAIITHLPLIGPVAGGKDQALLSIPVGLKGDLRDPNVTLLPPEAIGEGIVNLIINTFKMPLAIFSPFTNISR